MYELIKDSLQAYASLTVFTGLLLFSVILGTFKKTKSLTSKKIRTVIRFGVSSALICFWTWFFVYINLYPISLAYYEYNHDYAEEKIGVIDSAERDGKDRIKIVIDGKEYIMVYSSVDLFLINGRDLDKGDIVKIIYGVKSKYIFDITKSNMP